MKFNIDTYKKEIKRQNMQLHESSLGDTGLPEKGTLYNLIRGKLLQIHATNPISKPESYVFGKIRTISDVPALEYSQNSITENSVEEKYYIPGEKFRFLDTVYVVQKPFTPSFTNMFELKNLIYTLTESGYIDVDIVTAEFGISKLGVVANNQKSAVAASQEFIQDLEAVYGRGLLEDSIATTAAERINRSMVRLLEQTSVQIEHQVATENYEEARSFVGKLIQEASFIQRDTGNTATYIFCTPRVEALIRQSGLVDVYGFIGELEVISTRYYHASGEEYAILGFARDEDDRGEDKDTRGDAPYVYGSIIFAPYLEEFVDILDVENMSQNIMIQSRFGLSVAPYQEEKTWVLGGDVIYHSGKNLNARKVNVRF